ncbi:MAG TPA: glucose 1-dehydrogenase [candidate division Zixibacteria bacterium]|nr:glucose 1-dehydrogenase [candidate division Zixibacteria bacterium]
MRLQNRVAIITGAAHGIGRAYARRFAEEGAHVVIADIDARGGAAVADALSGAGLSAWARPTDVRDFTSLQGLVRETVDRYGRIDVLLNNAAIYVTQRLWKGPLEELEPHEWDRVLEVNLKGVFLCCKAVIPVMKRQRAGKIINIASGTFFSGSGNMPHYTAAKGGVVALTRVMARQLGDWNINVNCMTPGSTMSEEAVTDAVRKRREGSVEKRCFKRVETPADVVGTALFLASSESDFMTGQLLVVEGGGVLY